MEIPAAFSKRYRLSWLCPHTGQSFKVEGSFQEVMGFAAALLIDNCLSLLIEDATTAKEGDLDEAESSTLLVNVPAHLAKFAGG